MADDISEVVIAGKRLFLFESHHYALIPWARLRRESPRAPRLLTFDYHTDTHEAFLAYACGKFPPLSTLEPGQYKPIIADQVAAIDFHDDVAVRNAVKQLRYDEHIDASIRAGIVDVAFIVAYQDTGHIVSNEQRALDETRGEIISSATADGGIAYRIPQRQHARPPFTYTLPENRMVVLPKADIPDTAEEQDRPYRDAAIEDGFLTDRFQLLDRICLTAGVASLFSEPFILDIDLDYFNTKKSVSPNQSAVFYDLIRRASTITIARESSCVKSCQIDGEGLTSDLLQDAILKHVAVALK